MNLAACSPGADDADVRPADAGQQRDGDLRGGAAMVLI